ncbi:MAG: hypothetical protein BZY88_09465 [SAR202 cluster bacterium Io17-Chloro-G9]|nr:MAG: hypothetical protein BZY88_09465 [SAR202 cluster bacterium Io17-Chloro-G9]
MKNWDTLAAWSYHEATKLSYINLNNKPPLYKRYQGLPVVPLPSGNLDPDVPVLEAVASPLARPLTPLDLPGLAGLLRLSAGLIRKAQLPVAGEVHYRAAASAGALYPVEVYVVCGEIPDLEAGVYHFSPTGFSLVRLRQGDFRGNLAAALADTTAVDCAASLVLTVNFWRSAWKYRLRGYRYCYWDTGTILSNLLATASAQGLRAQVICGFLDGQVNGLLGLDSSKEAAVCIVPLGGGADVPQNPTGPPGPLESLAPHAVDDVKDEIDYPEIMEIHRASSFSLKEEVVAWGRTEQAAPPVLSQEKENLRSIDTTGDSTSGNLTPASGPLGQAILERGSTRRFARRSIPFSKFSAVLSSATTPVAADFLPSGQPSLLDTYVIANGVEDLAAGSYFYSPTGEGLESLTQGTLRHEAGHLCFEQALGADASAVFYFMADLGKVLSRYGDRGYRAAQLEAGILGGRVYLCAHALGLGASGMTFYDDDVTEFFSPHAAGKSLMFLVALGETHENNRVRPFRSRVGILLDSLARGAGNPTPDVNRL